MMVVEDTPWMGVVMSVMVAFSVTPVGSGVHVGDWVAEAVRVVRASGLDNRTDAMFTVVEGDDLGEVMGVVNAAIEAVAARCDRVSVSMKVDYFPGRDSGMESKVAAVETRVRSAAPRSAGR